MTFNIDVNQVKGWIFHHKQVMARVCLQRVSSAHINYAVQDYHHDVSHTQPMAEQELGS